MPVNQIKSMDPVSSLNTPTSLFLDPSPSCSSLRSIPLIWTKTPSSLQSFMDIICVLSMCLYG